ncbi:MAG: hypothetical protein JST83_16510 [Bacteroidetes bacterium]|nr:hypothetical protein [Bacteroidota bacterium]
MDLSFYEKHIIRTIAAFLWKLKVEYSDELTVNQIGWIEDDINLVEYIFLQEEGAGECCSRFNLQETVKRDFIWAYSLLSVRLLNTLKYLNFQ